MKYHRNAKTNIFVRKQIARRIKDGEPVTKVAREFGITRKVAYKWAAREDFKDKTSRPKKYGYPQCKWLPPKEKVKIIRYEKDNPGELVHLDTFGVYLGGKKYNAYVSIDDCTRLLYAKILDYKTQDQARYFLDLTRTAFPFKIEKILTDNGQSSVVQENVICLRWHALTIMKLFTNTQDQIVHKLTEKLKE